MSDNKLKVFIPGAPSNMYAGYTELENIVNSQLEVITDDDLVADPSLGADITTSIYCGGHGPKIFSRKEEGLLPMLGVVCNHGVGVNHMPFEKMKTLGLRLTNTPDILSDSTADMALALMLASGRQFSIGMEWSMRKQTEEKTRLFSSLQLGQEISYATLGIVGMGSIGLKIAQRAKAFHMNIVYHNRTRRENDVDVGATYYADLFSMLPLCDFVIISCPLTAETKGLFTSEQFKAMKPTAHLINVARGAVVNTDSLVEALKSKEIAAAALDVTDPEPLPDSHPLLAMDNVIIVPHWGSATVQTRGKMIQLCIDNCKAFADGKPLLTEVKF